MYIFCCVLREEKNFTPVRILLLSRKTGERKLNIRKNYSFYRLEMVKGIILQCKECKYIWRYHGKSTYRASCPNCHTSVLIKPRKRIIVMCKHCKHVWPYRGKKDKFITCPKCRKNLLLSQAKYKKK